MGQFSAEKPVAPGSALSGNQHGHDAEAREALQHYLAMPSSAQLRTIAALKAYDAQLTNANKDPRALECVEREYDGLRKAGMPEE
jgi:hypothetical protein